MVKTSFVTLFVAVLAVTSSSLAAAGKSNSKDCATGTFPPDNDVTQSTVVDTTETVEDAYAPDASADTTATYTPVVTTATYTPVVTTAAPTTAPTPVMTTATPTVAPTPAATTVAPASEPTSDDDSQDDASSAQTTDDSSVDVATSAPTTDDSSLDEATGLPTSAPTTDDGSLNKSLDLRTGGKAFAGSAAAWTTQGGDGLLKIVFESTDNKDVRVNILSGDKKKKIAEVPVKKGQTVTWTAPLADVQDKSLYLDRWRPGLFGLPGTGGGWLQLWVQKSSEGGHLELNAKINVS